MARGRAPLWDRFWSYVDDTNMGGCWTWTGTLSEFGYGVIGRGGRGEGVALAHRLSWEINRGPIPEGLAVMHLCDNPPCVRPDHLKPGTWAENNSHMAAEGRRGYTGSPGEKHPAAKLTRAQADLIRASTERAVDLARRYGVDASTITDIRKGRTWLSQS